MAARVDVAGNIEGEGDSIDLPGFVNAHSHAFQRALRGRVETRNAAHAHDDFWAWRTAMYRDAASVTTSDVEALAAWAFADMLAAGFTTVAEFHYLHHDVGGVPCARPELSLALARAAAEVGIRLVILETAYARGGPGRELAAEQRRFAFPSSRAFLEHVERSIAAVQPLNATVAVAIHSVRACPRSWIEDIAAFARARAVPLHVHACEQRKEIEQCRAEHGMSPVALLHSAGALSPSTTVVHATHVDAQDVSLLASSGATVCLTPSTERNLGDGLCPIADLVSAGVPICIGTDSNARIDLVDELRSLEDHERLRTEHRNVLVAPGKRLAHAVIPAGTAAGARALNVATSSDRVSVEMPLEGRAGGPAVGLDAWLVGGSSATVREVVVDGRVVVRGGKLTGADRAVVEARAGEVLKRLRAPG